MKLANFSVNRPISILMIMIALVLIGAVAVPKLPVDLYPNLNIPVAVVSTSWPGASPSEVETEISKKVESSMATLAGVKEVDSQSRTGSSNVIVQFNYNVNLDQAMLNMRDKIDRVRPQLPDDADAPTVIKIDPNSQPIVTLALYGKLDPIELRNLADNIVSPAIQRVNGVAQVGVSGGRVREVQVNVDPNKLTQYGLSINQVVSALQNDNTSMDAGLVNKGQTTVPLHLKGEFRSTAEIEKVQIPLAKGNSVSLGNVAQVVDTYKDITVDTRKDGQQSASITILKQSDANTVTVSDQVQKAAQDIKAKLPAGVQLAVLNDSAKIIRDSISTVVEHTLLGGVFSILILLLFLRNVRATLIIGVVIPISVISTFSMMYFANQSINTITLGGLALGLGSLVDFAVVVLESIFRQRSQGLSMAEAAKKGTSEVGTAVMASALAQIAVFLPAAFTDGLAAQIFTPIALTVSFSHIAALFAAITLVPMLASKMLKGHFDEAMITEGKKWNPFVLFQRFMKRVYAGYGRLLQWALGHRKTVVITSVALFVASVALVPLVGTELTPSVDQGQFSVSLTLAQGTRFDATNARALQVEDMLHKLPEVETVFTTVGGGGGGAFSSASTNVANLSVTLKQKAQRSKTTDEVMEDVRTKLGDMPGVKINVQASGQNMGGGGGGNSAVQVTITGPDMRVLQKLGDLVADEVRQVPGTRNVENTLDQSIGEYDLTVDRDAAAHFGVGVREVMTALRTAYQGNVATSFKTGDSAIDVTVRYPKAFTQQLGHLNQLIITTQSGLQVPLSEVAKVEPGAGPAQINRKNQQRQATVQAAVFNAATGTVTSQVQQRIAAIQPPEGYQISMGGSSLDMASSFQSLGLMLILSILLVYMVMASQFESLYGPFVIMFSLPPTFVGALIGLVVTHRTINMSSIIGMIMLVGIVVNNAIVLIDYTNQLRRSGKSLYDALLEAGPVRLRPILMTTGTTVLAMLPLVIGFGEGAETQASMATVVAFGLVFSTLVTLVLVPVVYMILDKWFDRWKGFRGRFRKKSNSSASDSLSV